MVVIIVIFQDPLALKATNAFNTLARKHGVYAVGGASCQAGQRGERLGMWCGDGGGGGDGGGDAWRK